MSADEGKPTPQAKRDHYREARGGASKFLDIYLTDVTHLTAFSP